MSLEERFDKSDDSEVRGDGRMGTTPKSVGYCAKQRWPSASGLVPASSDLRERREDRILATRPKVGVSGAGY